MNEDRSTLSLPSADLVVISGGQTGVDRAALDAARQLGIAVAGWCPRGRRSEDGRIPSVYELTETESWNYAVRTKRNVGDSDGTLILALGELSGGTRLTAELARRSSKPLHVVLLDNPGENSGTDEVRSVVYWVTERKIRVLNVAGPRGSSDQRIYPLSREFCQKVFAALLAATAGI